jgi:DNA-binding NtrC family response regulator
MNNFKIFIIEDDAWYAEFLGYTLGLNPEYEIEIFNSGNEALKNLFKRPSAITLDYGLRDMKGDEVLEKIKELYPDLPVVIISAQEDIGIALELLKHGAYDYIIKNDETKDRIWKIMTNIRDLYELKDKNDELSKEVKTKYNWQASIIGESPELQTVFKMIDKVRDSKINISITGETGTGKELIAKAVHYNSSRADFPFVAVNM